VETQSRVVVFDGLCNLCSGGARWLQHHPSDPPFSLVPMQSDLGRKLLTQHGCDPDDPLTFLVLDGDRCLTQSDAWIHLVAAAGPAWRHIAAARCPDCGELLGLRASVVLAGRTGLYGSGVDHLADGCEAGRLSVRALIGKS
jgi:hypothetical protein